MRLRPITTRRLMVVVAAVTVILGIALEVVKSRRASFERKTAYHEWMRMSETQISGAENLARGRLCQAAFWRYHGTLFLKYKQAATRPWMPVWFDPPEPALVPGFTLTRPPFPPGRAPTPTHPGQNRRKP
jgi:hypothetical protein